MHTWLNSVINGSFFLTIHIMVTTSLGQVFLAQKSRVFLHKMHLGWVNTVQIVSVILFDNLLKSIYRLLSFKIVVWCDWRILTERVEILLAYLVATQMLAVRWNDRKWLGLGAWLSHQGSLSLLQTMIASIIEDYNPVQSVFSLLWIVVSRNEKSLWILSWVWTVLFKGLIWLFLLFRLLAFSPTLWFRWTQSVILLNIHLFFSFLCLHLKLRGGLNCLILIKYDRWFFFYCRLRSFFGFYDYLLLLLWFYINIPVFVSASEARLIVLATTLSIVIIIGYLLLEGTLCYKWGLILLWRFQSCPSAVILAQQFLKFFWNTSSSTWIKVCEIRLPTLGIIRRSVAMIWVVLWEQNFAEMTTEIIWRSRWKAARYCVSPINRIDSITLCLLNVVEIFMDDPSQPGRIICTRSNLLRHLNNWT